MEKKPGISYKPRTTILGDHNQQIFASRYQLHLPTEEQLQRELQRELDKLTLPKLDA